MTISKLSIPESAWHAIPGEIDPMIINTPLIQQWETVVQRQPGVLAIADSNCALTQLQLWNAVMSRVNMINSLSKPGIALEYGYRLA